MDKGKIDNFWLERTKIKDPRIATNYRDDGRLGYDVKLVSEYISENAKVLDLGAGTCTLSGPFLDNVEEIVAVDKYAGFLDIVEEHPRLRKICADVAEYKSSETFDLILLFGVVNFLTIKEEINLYERCKAMLKENGKLLVKNQCGKQEEIVVDKYSEELKANYHARYPFAEEQENRLSRFFDVKSIDIYPPELNRWPDTHFYAYVCKKV